MPAAPGDGGPAARAGLAEAAIAVIEHSAATPRAAITRRGRRVTSAGGRPGLVLNRVPVESGFGVDDRQGESNVIPAPHGLHWRRGPLEDF